MVTIVAMRHKPAIKAFYAHQKIERQRVQGRDCRLYKKVHHHLESAGQDESVVGERNERLWISSNAP